MKKSFLVICFLLALFLFCACGGNAPSEETETDAPDSSTEAETQPAPVPVTASSYVREHNYAASLVKDTMSDGVVALLSCAEYYCDRLLSGSESGEVWVYTNSDTYAPQRVTFDTMIARKNRSGLGANCASIANWAMIDIGVMPASAKYFGYSDNTVHGYDGGKNDYSEYIDASCEVIDARETTQTLADLVRKKMVKDGDMVFCKGHTFMVGTDGMLYASGHDSVWHEDLSAKTEDTKHAVFDSWRVKMTSSKDYSGYTILAIFRIRDDYVPTHYRDENGKLTAWPSEEFIASLNAG